MKHILFILALLVIGAINIDVMRESGADANSEGYALEGEELKEHRAKMRRYGIKNTETVYVHHDNSEWFYDEKGRYCRFK